MVPVMSPVKKLMLRLAENAWWNGWRFEGRKRPSLRDGFGNGVPGDFIKRLSDEERELLKGLRSEDIANVIKWI